jgi:DNA-binding HxlR family transcriptional regulator
VTAFGEFCPYAKAVEHLGDRWSLLIIKELAMHGKRGFNALADGMPGVSRSVLSRRLRKLEELGLIARDPLVRSGVAPYRLAPAGEQLVPNDRTPRGAGHPGGCHLVRPARRAQKFGA